MAVNISAQPISSSFQDLILLSGSQLQTAVGNDITNLTITASDATTASYAVGALSASHAQNTDNATSAISSSHAVNADNATSASWALYAVSASVEITKEVSSSYADRAGFAEEASGSTIIGAVALATNADTASYVLASNIDGVITSASHALIADNAVSSSHAITADGAISASFATTANDAVSASHAITADGAVSSSYAVNADDAISASYALFATTASYALNVPDTASYALFALSSSQAENSNTSISASHALNANIAISSSHALQADNADTAITASHAVNALSASHALIADDAVSSSYALNSTTASHAVNALSSSHALQADNADNSVSASHAVNALSASHALIADDAVSASYALNSTTASHALELKQGIDVSLNSGSFNYLTADSASFGVVNYVSGSATIIGDAFIVLNADSPTLRYAGMQVFDSGSSFTGSFEWDSIDDNWIQVKTNGQSAGVLVGANGTKGSEVYPTANTILKGTGNENIVDSIITDDGSLVNISGDLNIGGTTTGLFQGDLDGTANIALEATFATSSLSASHAVNADVAVSASQAENANTAVSSSHALQADNADTATSASYASNIPSTINENLTINGSTIGQVQAVIPDGGGNAVLDCANYNFFTLTMDPTTTTTISATGARAGQTINIKLTQNATPGTIAFDSQFKFEGGNDFVASIGAGDVDLLSFVCLTNNELIGTGIKNVF